MIPETIIRKALAGESLSDDDKATIAAIPTPPAPAIHIKFLVGIVEHEGRCIYRGAIPIHRSKVVIHSKTGHPNAESPVWINTTDLVNAGLPIDRDHSHFEAVLSIRPLAADEKFDFAFNTPQS